MANEVEYYKIPGNVETEKNAYDKLKKAGVKCALPLVVDGALHSPLMEITCVELAKAIEAALVSIPSVYQDVDALAHSDAMRSRITRRNSSFCLYF